MTIGMPRKIELTEEGFEVVSSAIGITHLFPRQIGILESVGFDYIDECEEFIGNYFPDEEWRIPDPDLVVSFFESLPNQLDRRIRKYKIDGMLTNREVDEYKVWRQKHFETNGDLPGYFIGRISCQSKELVVFRSSCGYAFEGVDHSLLGIFDSLEDGISTLFPDGCLVGAY